MSVRLPIRLGLLFIVFALVRSVSGQNPVVVTLPDMTANIGDTVEMVGRISCPSRDCSGYELTIRFDPAVIRVDSAIPGEYMGTNVRTPARANRIDNETGLVVMAAVGGTSPAPSEDRLFLLTLTALEAGETSLTIEQLSISGRGATRLSAAGVNGRIVVAGMPILRLQRTLVAREGPGSTFAAVMEVPAGEALPIVGISPDGAWFYVQLEADRFGWLVNAPQFISTSGDLASIPMVEPTAPTLTNTPTEFPTITDTPTLTLSPTITPTPLPTEPVLATIAPSVPTDTPSPTLTDTPSLTPTPTITNTPQPCILVARGSGVIVRVGPNPNRTGRATMVPNREYRIRGQAAGTDGVTWYNLVWANTAEPDRFWVSENDVIERGDCDLAAAVPTSSIMIARPTTAQTAGATITGTRSVTPTMSGTPPTPTATTTTGGTTNPDGIDCSGMTLYEPVGAFTPSESNLFSWSPVFGAIHYRLTISNGTSWIIYQTLASSPGAYVNLSTAPSDPRWNGQIAWTVQAIKSGSGSGEIRCESYTAIAMSLIP